MSGHNELRAAAEAARLWFPSEDHDGMDETPWMDAEWWASTGLDERHALFAAKVTPDVVLGLLEEVKRLREGVRSLADDAMVLPRRRGQTPFTYVTAADLRALLDGGSDD